MPQQILVLGGGFAGLWAAVGAARKLDELTIGSDAVRITLVNRDPFHSIRVRNYEPDLSPTRVRLDDVLEPIGVERVEASVAGIDVANRVVTVAGANGESKLRYDRLVFALGSQLVRPPVSGVAECAYDVDTYDGAEQLNEHLKSLSQLPDRPGLWTVVVVGAGLTGIEAATEMPVKIRAMQRKAGIDRPFRVILADRNPFIGSDMGEHARPVIEQALTALGIESCTGIGVESIDSDGLVLTGGETVPAATVVWCAGMRASPMTEAFPVERDRLGRLPVDEFLQVAGVPGVFAAGDSAAIKLDPERSSVMSCQHGRPMGRFAGHNVVCDLLGLAMLPLHIDWYVTVLDLGEWGALYTQGWDRRVAAAGAAAKATKQEINCRRIYPPLNRNREDILAAAAPVVQRPPDLIAKS